MRIFISEEAQPARYCITLDDLPNQIRASSSYQDEHGQNLAMSDCFESLYASDASLRRTGDRDSRASCARGDRLLSIITAS